MERGFSLRNGGAEPGAFPKGVRAIPASARIHAALREQIIGMEIPPGAALQEKQIALACGVSRTPVREALLKLADERLVDIFPQYGTFVSRISIPAMRDAMVIRIALERAAVRGATANATPADIATLRALLVAQQEAHDAGRLAAFHDADEALHQTISEIAGHPNLWRVVRQEKAHVDRCRILTLPATDRRVGVMIEHAAIVAAIAKGDAEAAEAAMQAHLDQVLPTVTTLLPAHADYFVGDDVTTPQMPAGATRADAAISPQPAPERKARPTAKATGTRKTRTR